MYYLRLDDASHYMDLYKWKRVEVILDKYGVKPIVGVIPSNKDPDLLKYDKVSDFWELVKFWSDKGWTIALHGFSHVFETDSGGINPVNDRSEYAGLCLEYQRQKVKDGYSILKRHDIIPDVFFAPAHTFDKNTLIALKEETPIRIICDTVANDIYFKDGFYFLPQQSGRCRRLPFKTVTFCYHPNVMSENDFELLECFLQKNYTKFSCIKNRILIKRKLGFLDRILSYLYFKRKMLI